MARPTSAIPGPSSRATTATPALPFRCTGSTTISPSLAYLRMFRASSEIAVAIMVVSAPPNPPSSATEPAEPAGGDDVGVVADRDGDLIHWRRRRARAGDRSRCARPSSRSRTVVTPSRLRPSWTIAKADVGLDADDHGLSAAQPHHLGDRPQRPRRERVEHVEHGDVDDHALRAEPPDAIRELVAQLEQVGVGQRRLDRGDQAVTLLENRDGHPRPPAISSPSATTR